MIIETVVSTGTPPNFAPMGVMFEKNALIIRPFRTTTTCRNLAEKKCGVVNITDNVLIFAKSALSDSQFPHFKAKMVEGYVLGDACRWYEFVVDDLLENDERVKFLCNVVYEGKKRDFLGFNRGKNAVIEASLLATRLPLYKKNFIKYELAKLNTIVEKTGGDSEREAMNFIMEYVEAHT